MIETIIRPRYISASIDEIDQGVADIVKKSIQERKGQSMYIYGDTGVGKSYIAYAIYNLVKKHNLPCAVVRSLDIVEATKATFMGLPSVDHPEYENIHNMSKFLKELGTYKGLLIIDDIGSEKSSEGVAVKLFQIINDRYEWMNHTIYTSNLNLNELKEKVGDRIVSRIVEDCKIIKIEGEDKRN